MEPVPSLPGLPDPTAQAEGAQAPAEPPRRGPGRPPGVKNRPKVEEPAAPVAGMDERAVANAWIGLWVLVTLVARFLGYEPIPAPPEGPEGGGPLTVAEAREDARQLLPLVQRYPGIARILSWVGAPIVIVRRLSEKFRRRPKAAIVPKPPAEA